LSRCSDSVRARQATNGVHRPDSSTWLGGALEDAEAQQRSVLEPTGLLLYLLSETQAAELEGSRRLELQASCFGDIFIGSNKRTYAVTGQALFQWKWLIVHWTDYSNDHSDGVNHQYWATRGFTSRNPGVCNTFAGKVQ